MTTRIFLTAEWRYLLMLNYEIDPAILQPLVPKGTELDEWNGRIYASMVGFLFQKTRLLGFSVPGHINFEEVNLRFYVRRRGPEGWRRGVVFVKELVPRWAIATVAQIAYNENYQALPMRHQLKTETNDQQTLSSQPQTSIYKDENASIAVQENITGVAVAYEWQFQKRWQGMRATTQGTPAPIQPGSEAEFITEHYWGYAAQRNGGTVEYQVEHPRWQVWSVSDYQFDCDVADLYGPQFVAPLNQPPTSVFIADGSGIAVHKGERIA